jgi:riboflavin kinase / FMN adenylyltransferase
VRIFRTLDSIVPPGAGCALAVGNFDGLHRGHRRIIRRLFREAEARGLPAFVLTFAPHPEKIFGPDRILMIQTLDQRLEALRALHLSAVAVLPFTRAFARTGAEAFVDQILAGALKARVVVVGADFRFGRDRRGDAALLKRLGPRRGFVPISLPPLVEDGAAVSSSRIRALLEAGRVDLAARLLGRPYEIEGDVVRGAGRGRRLGFPTANIRTANEILPRGVYATRLIRDGRGRPSVTNIGRRPTFQGLGLTVETHVLDGSPELYGASVRLAFLRRLRAEQTFADAEALAAGIRRDVAAARRHFHRLCP